MASPKARQAASILAGNLQQDIATLRQELDRKHVRLEKLIRSSAQQVAAATTQALQHQLANMQKQMLVSLNPAAVQLGQEGASLPGAPMGEVPQHVLANLKLRNSMSSMDSGDQLFEDANEDPFSDFDLLGTDDEDLARRQYENAGRKKKKKDVKEVKQAWEEDSQDEDKKLHRDKSGSALTLRDGDKEMLKKKAHAVARRTVNEEAMPPGRAFARKVVFSQRFEWVAACILVGNSLLVGIETEWTLQNLNQDPHAALRVLDIFFNICFSVELLLRVAADQKFFVSFYNPALHWNILDMVLVSSALLEELVNVVEASGPNIDVSVLRMLRMVRLLRVARIIRMVRFFNDLRVMVNGIKASSRALLWAIALLLLVTYLFGVTFMQLSATYLEATGRDGNLLITYYGSLTRTILTLFMTISGGMLWNEALRPLSDIHWMVDVLFLLYIISTTFCCLNIMTGIFVDNAQASKKTDESVVRQEWEKERRQWIADVAELFYKVDTDNSGDVTKNKFCSLMYSDRVQTLLRKLGIGIDGYSPSELWDLLDGTGRGSVVQAEFAHAIRQMMGNGRGIDIYRIKKDTRSLTKEFKEFKKHMTAVFPELQS